MDSGYSINVCWYDSIAGSKNGKAPGNLFLLQLSKMPLCIVLSCTLQNALSLPLSSRELLLALQNSLPLLLTRKPFLAYPGRSDLALLEVASVLCMGSFCYIQHCHVGITSLHVCLSKWELLDYKIWSLFIFIDLYHLTLCPKQGLINSCLTENKLQFIENRPSAIWHLQT